MRDNWDDLRYVLAVAEEGSVSGAARRLGVNHATVLRRIAAFEEAADLSLFEKGPQGYDVPPDLDRIIAATREVDEAVVQFRLCRALDGGDPATRLYLERCARIEEAFVRV